MATELPYINYSCYFSAFRDGEQFSFIHSIGMIISGEMELKDGNQKQIFKKGDLYFAKKNQLIKFVKRPSAEEEFKSVSLYFDDDFLRSYAHENISPQSELKKKPSFLLLAGAEYLHYFMNSLLQYQDLLENKTTPLVQLKQKEALALLLSYDASFGDILFDFSEPYKINLEEFMNKNYHFNIGLERFAYLTGRSLSSFKRDFQKIFGSSPRQWLQQKRLKEAYFLIKNKQQKPGAVYLDLGFEDFSHFSFTFKKYFGISPSELLQP